MLFGSKQLESKSVEEILENQLVEGQHDPYKVHKDALAILHGQGFDVHGVYRGMTAKGDYVLMPSVNREFTPNSSRDFSNGENKLVIVGDRPTYIRSEVVTGISPMSEGYWNQIVRGETLESRALEKFMQDYSI